MLATLASRVSGEDVSVTTATFETDVQVDAEVITASVFDGALVPVAILLRLVFPLAAVVDSVADEIQRHARPVPALQLFIRIASAL